MPSAFFRALGKQPICRVYSTGHSANILHSAIRSFAECHKYDTRQTAHRHSAKVRHSVNKRRVHRTCTVRHRTGPAVSPLPSVGRRHSAKRPFAECHPPTLGNSRRSPSATPRHSANILLRRVPHPGHSANKKKFRPLASTLFLLPT